MAAATSAPSMWSFSAAASASSQSTLLLNLSIATHSRFDSMLNFAALSSS